MLKNYFILCVALVMALIGLALWWRSRNRDPKIYDAKSAWMRAGLYFCACFILSWATGALSAVLSAPLATPENLADPAWIAFTALCFIVEFVGYYLIWPKGTLTHGRELHLPTILLFGWLWGISEAQLFLSVWAVTDWLIASKLIVAIVTFIILSAFIGLWHALYWDIYVAPEHNIAEWNSRKVLFAHIPNLVVTLTYLAVYGNFGMFILFQTFSLLGSTYFMRFPPFREVKAG